MRPSSRLARRLRAALAIVVLVLLGAVGTALPAAAHAGLAASNPAVDAVLPTAPATVRLRFNEAVAPVAGAFALYDSAGRYTVEGRPATVVVAAVDGVVTANLPETLPAGSYLLSWRVVSADSHPVSGVLPFVVGHASARPATAPAAADSLGGLVGSTYLALQILGYLGLFTAVGLRVFDVVVLRRSRTAERGTRQVLLGAAGATVTAYALLLPLTVLRERAGRWTDLRTVALWRDGLSTPAGTTLALVVAGLALLLGAARLPLRWSRPFALAGGLVALTSVLATGHTRTATPSWLVNGADLVHVAAAAVWLGGLVGLGLYLARARRLRLDPVPVAAVLARFSGLAGVTVGLLGASGLMLALLVPGSWRSLLSSDYGHALAAKLALVAVLGVLAGWNRYALVPAVQRRPDSAARWRRLRSAVVDECVIVVLAIAVTGLLTSLNPESGPAGPSSADTAAVAVVDTAAKPAGSGAAGALRRADLGSGSLQGRLLPGTAGPNTFEFTLRDADGAPLTGQTLPEVSASLPSAQLGPLHATVRRLPGTAHYRAELPLPVGGDWRLIVSVRQSTYDEPTTTLLVPVAG